EIFARGGFDVVIGNPPYVDIKGLEPEITKALFKIFKTTENRINLYSIFIEKGFEIVRPKGYLSYINPNSILVNSSYTKIRKLLLEHMTTIVKLPDGVFKDAIVETIIFELRKDSNLPEINTIVFPKNSRISYIDNSVARIVKKENWKSNKAYNFNIYVNENQMILLNKIRTNSTELGEIADFTLGITPYDKYKGHSEELIKNRQFHSKEKVDNTYKPLISGSNITRYLVSKKITEYIKYGNWLGAPREERFFTEPRILIRQIVSGIPPRIYAGYSDEKLYYTQIGFGIIPKPNTINIKVLLGIINSKLITFYHKYSYLDLEKELFQKILIANCKKFPVKNSIKESDLTELENLVNSAIDISTSKKIMIHNFSNYFSNLLKIEISNKLENWHELEFSEFAKEINSALKQKSINKLTKHQEMEWFEIFESKKKEIDDKKIDFKDIDNRIDKLVYQIYELNPEEIKIIEESI
ncbi:MAG: restriction endonuclease subunit M, partial [Saprospirales bacterium]